MSTSLRKKITQFVPMHFFLPASLCVAVNWLAYYGVRFLTRNAEHFHIDIWLDRYWPFHPAWVVVYLGSFLFWIFGYLMVARQGKEDWYRYVTANLMAKTVCGIIFLLFPTTMVRPEVTGDGIWEQLIRAVYQWDAPTELFPSIHCLESWFCYVGIRGKKQVPEWYRCLTLLFAILIFASTQFTKQHGLLDMAGAFILVEASYYIAMRSSLYRFVMRPCEIMHKKCEECNAK